MVTYTKLHNGTWGLKGNGLVAGQTVVATRKSGATQQEVVGRVVWTGPDGTTIAAIDGRDTRVRGGGPRRTGRRYYSRPAQQAAPVAAPSLVEARATEQQARVDRAAALAEEVERQRLANQQRLAALFDAALAQLS